jgi:flavin-dependent dehydrogenase
LWANDRRLAERLVLLDKARFPREKICAGAIGARADRLLETIDVRVNVPSAALAGLRVKTPVGSLSARLEDGAPIGRVVRRAEFDAALLDEVRSRGMRVCDGVAVRSVTREREGILLETSDGPLRARAVIGADGVGSLVRRATGIARGRYHAQAVEVDTPWRSDDAPTDLLSFDVSDNRLTGYAWDFPTMVNGKSLVCRGIYHLTRGMPQGERLDATEYLRERLAAQGVATEGLRFKRFAERGISLNSPTAVDRMLLVGEAAGIDPVLGEGIPQAIFYGKTAGAYLACCMRRGDYRFVDWAKRMRRERIGFDLSVRALLPPFFYGSTRPIAERWVTRSHALARAGLSYFGGRVVPRRSLAVALVDLARSVF